MANLNATQLRFIKSEEKDFTLSDGEGLQLLVKKSGIKLWEFRFTSPISQKRRKTSLGSYPKTSLAAARSKKNELLLLLSQNIDPIEKTKQEKQEKIIEEEKKIYTIEYIVEKYFILKQHNKKIQDNTMEKARGRVSNHIYAHLPKKGNTSIYNITFELMVDILSKLESVGKLETLDRTKKIMIEVFKYAYTENILKEIDLFAKLELKTFKRLTKADIRNHPTISDISTIAQLLKDMRVYDGEIYTRYALLMSIYTAQRQGSLISALWSDIDFKNKVWVIPAMRMKMKRAHILPLSKQMIKILKDLYQYSGTNKYLFPNTQHENSHMSNNTVNSALRKMKYPKELIVAHGFRSMFSTICNEHISDHNISFEFIEKALSHQEKNQIREVYNRAKNLKELKTLMQWYADFLDEIE